MHLFSDLTLFERPPRPGLVLFRWIAWRWILIAALFIVLVAAFAAIHHLGGEPVYYTNEHRYLSDAEVADMFGMFLAVGVFFLVFGLAGVFFIPKS